MNLSKSRKYNRLFSGIADEVSTRTYNLFLGGAVLYGLIANFLICYTVGDKALQINPIVLIIGYFVCCFTGIIMSFKSNSPIISFIGYNLVVIPIGLVMSIIISTYVKEGMGDLIPQAVLVTAAVTTIMIGLSIVFPSFFSKLGRILSLSLTALIIIELVALFFFPGALHILAWASAGIFSMYIGYDFWKAQKYPKTINNAVDSAIDIYLDIVNLFLDILEILSDSKSSKKE